MRPQILGEFDDAALMKAFGLFNQRIFVAPSIYKHEILVEGDVALIGETQDLKEEYYVIFAERMIQHPAVKMICDSDYTALFSGEEDITAVSAVGIPPSPANCYDAAILYVISGGG